MLLSSLSLVVKTYDEIFYQSQHQIFFFIITIRIINEKNKKPTKWKETKDKWETNAFVIPFLRHEMPGKELKAILLFNKYKND